MKLKHFLLNFSIVSLTFVLGVSLFGIYRVLVGYSSNISQETMTAVKPAVFDINDPNSVLPIDYEEEKLSDPKEDETNEDMFDPEGSYFLDETSEDDSSEFGYFDVYNKNFDLDVKDKNFGELVAPSGKLFVDENSNGFSFKSISISDGKLHFKTENIKGIEYEFSGEFLVKGNFYTLDVNAKVLKGFLIKTVNGVRSESQELFFGWTLEGGC